MGIGAHLQGFPHVLPLNKVTYRSWILDTKTKVKSSPYKQQLLITPDSRTLRTCGQSLGVFYNNIL